MSADENTAGRDRDTASAGDGSQEQPADADGLALRFPARRSTPTRDKYPTAEIPRIVADLPVAPLLRPPPAPSPRVTAAANGNGHAPDRFARPDAVAPADAATDAPAVAPADAPAVKPAVKPVPEPAVKPAPEPALTAGVPAPGAPPSVGDGVPSSFVPEFGELPPLGPAVPLRPSFAPAPPLLGQPPVPGVPHLPPPAPGMPGAASGSPSPFLLPPGPLPVAHLPRPLSLDRPPILPPGMAAHPPAHRAPAPPPRPWTARRKLFWTAAATATLAVIGGVAFAGYGVVTAGRPQHTVERYYGALSRGDAAKALSYGDVPQGDRSYLTGAVLKKQLDRARIESLDVTSVKRNGSTATVSVTYRAVGASESTTVDDLVILHKAGYRWKLASTAVPTTIAVAAAKSRVSLAGAPVPGPGALFFPGALPLETNTSLLAFDLASTVVTFDAKGPLSAALTVSADGTTQVMKAVDTALTACAQGGASADPACPTVVNSPGFVPGSLKGTLTTLPSASNSNVTVATSDVGVVEVSGQFTIDGTWSELDFNNRAQPKSGPLTLQYRAWVPAMPTLTAYWTAVG